MYFLTAALPVLASLFAYHGFIVEPLSYSDRIQHLHLASSRLEVNY